jgi:glycosyltransferase involved in cell wall biosynthesis
VGYENFSGFVAAFANSPRLRKNFRIICFGGGKFCSDERNMMALLDLEADLMMQIAGSDADLADLYSAAAALIYPSLYEGFGIPLLEPMSLGCPVICRNTSSLPEVVGSA